ncbi:MAG: hypothetical protein JWP74_1703 [Marmoricola sp.]|nr:hypothetical protein [Marmoricola sp.]
MFWSIVGIVVELVLLVGWLVDRRGTGRKDHRIEPSYNDPTVAEARAARSTRNISGGMVPGGF